MSANHSSISNTQPFLPNPKALLIPLTTFVLSMIVWYICSVQLGWGKAASEHDPASIWGYVLKTWMIGMALLLPLLSGFTFKQYGWRWSLPWLLLAIVVGLAQGLGNRGGYQMGVIAVLGSGFHSFGIEIYFRAYLINAFKRAFGGFWPPVLLSSLMYGLYHLSVYPAMQENPFVFYVPFFTVLGILFALLYTKSRSFLITWVCHWIAVLPIIPAIMGAM